MLPLFDSQPPPNLTDIILNALASGVVVTANARSARTIALRHAEQQQTNGLKMWPSPAIFDWDSWLNRLWQECVFSDPDAPLLLTDLQEHFLWMRVQQNDAPLVVRPDGLASLAQSAYERLSEYELHEERNNIWFETDAEHFRQWAQAFDRLCGKRKWASRSNMEALLIRALQTGTLTLPERILLVGFDRLTPAQQSLLQSFREAGLTAELASPEPPEATARTVLVANDARDELLTCAEWCRQKLANNPDVRIGVIVPDVAHIKTEVDRAFRDVLMPQSLDIANESAPMPFEFSLGVPLSTVPVIRAALLLLRWISAPLLEEKVSWLSLSGFFQSSSSEILDLARLDFKRRDSRALSPEVSFRAFVTGHAFNPFSKRLRNVLKMVEQSQALGSDGTYNYWCDFAQKILGLVEWPGYRPPDSVQFQAQQRWMRLLDETALLDFAGGKGPFSAFLNSLERHAEETIFTPESHHAPIQILGALESSGQTFDAIWFLGIDDTQWPPVARPHPFLPVALQRRAKMPHCDAATDTELAAVVTRRIGESAPECVFSCARQNKEGELRPSPILSAIFDDNLHSVSAVELRRQMNIPEPVNPGSQIEASVLRSQAIPWLSDRVAGGADVLKDQAACPFRAFGKRRFAAESLNRTEWGLDAAQRGSLLHIILETIWSPETPEPFRMVSLDDLRSVISAHRLDEALDYHIKNAFQNLIREHADDAWMRAYLKSEQQRLRSRLREWMHYEAVRQPFIVDKREERLTDVSLGELKLNLRADLIDKLPDGSHLLIDYKTGEVSVAAWKGERPDEPQLPLYATYGNIDHISGLLFAQIRAGKTAFIGRAANAQQTLLADLPAANSLVNQPYDQNMFDAWQQALLQLADEFLHGEASVDPKRGTETCKYCPLPGLCRVAEADLANEADDAETDYA